MNQMQSLPTGFTLRRLATLLYFIAICISSAQLADADTKAAKQAFVVGVGKYREPKLGELANPERDARLIATALQSIDFSIHGGKPLVDPTNEHLQDALERLLNRGRSNKASLRTLINGTPTVIVQIHLSATGRMM
jgi:hypothetical protein